MKRAAGYRTCTRRPSTFVKNMMSTAVRRSRGRFANLPPSRCHIISPPPPPPSARASLASPARVMDDRGRAHGPWILKAPADPPRAPAPAAAAPSDDDASSPPPPPPPLPVALRLFCVPQAGCGAWSFHAWDALLSSVAPRVEVMPLELPGRNSRHGERGDEFPTLEGAFYTLVPIRPRRRGERRSLRTFPGVSLRPLLGFNPRPRRLSTPPDAFQLHPDNHLYGTALEALAEAAAAGIEHLLPGGERSDDDAPNPPYAIFGHSMGAWIAFEMTRAIERRRSARAAAAAATAATTAAVRLLPIRPRSRGERRSLRTFPVVTLHPRFPFNV